MKKKLLLKSAAVMMSVLTLAPSFGDVTFAMKRIERQVAKKQENDVNNETIEIFKELVNNFKNSECDLKKLKNFLSRIKEDPLVSPYLNKNKNWKDMDNAEKNRIGMYSMFLAYLLMKNNFVYTKKVLPYEAIMPKGHVFPVGAWPDEFIIPEGFLVPAGTKWLGIPQFLKDIIIRYVCCKGLIQDLFSILYSAWEKFFQRNRYYYSSDLDFLRNWDCSDVLSKELHKQLLKEYTEFYNFCKQDDGTTENSVDKYHQNVVDEYNLLVPLTQTCNEPFLKLAESIENSFRILFNIFEEHINNYENNAYQELRARQCFADPDDVIVRSDDLKREGKKQIKKENNYVAHRNLVEKIKQDQPEVEARNKEQEQKRQEEKEKSRNTKKNKGTGVVEPNYSEPGMLLKDDKDRKEEAANKAKDRKQAKEIEKNQQKEKEKEKEKEIQKRQEEIEQLRERQKLPSDDLTDADINTIFTKKSVGVPIKSNNYTKIFTAGEDGVVNTVYFPFDLLNKVKGNNKQKQTIRASIKRMVYNISKLPENEFERLSLDTYTGSTLSQFLNKHFTQKAQVCFTNSNPENVYRFKINNKCQVVFVKKGNEIVVLDSLEHIDNGLQ